MAAFLLPAASASARQAYIANNFDDTVSVTELSPSAPPPVGNPIHLGSGAGPFAIAISPDGARAYVANFDAANVSVIRTATNNTAAVVPLAAGTGPAAIAISPDGARAYVANSNTDTVTVIDTATNTILGATIPVGDVPRAIAITPNGTRAYVANSNAATVSVIDIATNTPVGAAIPVGVGPTAIAITPDGTRAYVANSNAGSVSVIDTATNTPLGAAIPVGVFPLGIAISPDGSRAYVANHNLNNNDAGTVTVIDTATNFTLAPAISVGAGPRAIAIRPDGRRAYVPSYNLNNNGSVRVINLTDNTAFTTLNAGSFGTFPHAIAITPNQGPAASFVVSPAATGSPTSFDAAASSDPDGEIARYNWDFGDGHALLSPDATALHTYEDPGSHTATLTVADAEGGCSTAFIFTGQTAYCNGTAAATVAKQVVPPGDDLPPGADTTVTIEIAGGKLKLNKTGKGKLSLTCPAEEASPPCVGRLKLKTAKKLAVREAAKKKLTLARANFSLRAGQTGRVKLKLSKPILELVETEPAARKATATAKVSDAAGNTAKVTAKLTLKPA